MPRRNCFSLLLRRLLSSKLICFLMALHLLTRYLSWLNLGRIKLNLCFLFYCCFPYTLAKGKYICLHMTCMQTWLCFEQLLEQFEIATFFKLYLNCCLLLYIVIKLFLVISVLAPDLLISSTAPRTYPIQVTYRMVASSILVQF